MRGPASCEMLRHFCSAAVVDKMWLTETVKHATHDSPTAMQWLRKQSQYKVSCPIQPVSVSSANARLITTTLASVITLPDPFQVRVLMEGEAKLKRIAPNAVTIKSND